MLASAKMEMMMSTRDYLYNHHHHHTRLGSNRFTCDIPCWGTGKKQRKKETKILGENYKAMPCTGLINSFTKQ